MSKWVQVNSTNDQYDLLQKHNGEFGNNDSDAVKNIIIVWLTEKSFISTILKKRFLESRCHD